MRVALVAGALSIVCFAGGVRATVQAEEPAEKVFKNIVSFKGHPARDVIPSMTFFNKALGVKCSFCHARPFEADALPQKKRAREMIAMTKELNERNFHGAKVITCMTCHNGNTIPKGPITIAPSDETPKRDGDVAPQAVLDKFYEAIGGGLTSIELSGTSTDEGAKPEAITEIQGAPNKFVLKLPNQQLGFDGTTAWSKFQRVSKLWGENAVQVRRLGRLLWTKESLARHKDWSYVGKTKVDGKDAVVLHAAVAEDHNSENLSFDADSGLLLRIETITETPFGDYSEINDYSDYRDVGGSKVPFKIVQKSVEGTSTIIFDAAKPNVKVEDKQFAPPEGS